MINNGICILNQDKSRFDIVHSVNIRTFSRDRELPNKWILSGYTLTESSSVELGVYTTERQAREIFTKLLGKIATEKTFFMPKDIEDYNPEYPFNPCEFHNACENYRSKCLSCSRRRGHKSAMDNFILSSKAFKSKDGNNK